MDDRAAEDHLSAVCEFKEKKKKVKCTKRKACVSGGNTGVVLLLSLNMNLCEQDIA